MHNVVIALGSNMGERKQNIAQAIERIAEKVSVTAQAPLFETEPVGFEDQGWFVNSALVGETVLLAGELLVFLQSIEKNLGKKVIRKDGPRIIDLDIIFFDDMVINKKNLEVPHPRMHERLFVLEPLVAICPEWRHPTLNKTVQELKDELDTEKEVRSLN